MGSSKFFATYLWACISYHWNYPRLAWHSAERRGEESIRRECYWLHMANDMYNTVTDWHEFARTNSDDNDARTLQLFSASAQLEFVVMDILSALLNMLGGTHLIVLTKHCFSRITRSYRRLRRQHHTSSFFLLINASYNAVYRCTCWQVTGCSSSLCSFTRYGRFW